MLHTSTPKRAKIYKLKQELGILLKQGYVSDATKLKMRNVAMKYPELFGNWINI